MARVSPGPRTDQARADFRAHESPQHRQHIPAPARRAARGVRPAPGAVVASLGEQAGRHPAPGPAAQGAGHGLAGRATGRGR